MTQRTSPLALIALVALAMGACGSVTDDRREEATGTSTTSTTTRFEDLRIEAEHRSSPKKADKTIYNYTIADGEMTVQKTVTDVNGTTHDQGTQSVPLTNDQMNEMTALATEFVDDPSADAICTDMSKFKLIVADGDEILAERDALPCPEGDGPPFVNLHQYISDLHRMR